VQIKFITLKTFIIYVLITSFSFTGLTFDSTVIAAAEAFEAGDATCFQKAIVFEKNKTINHMRLYGVIDDDVYQANQNFFQTNNDKLSQKAAEKANLICNKQISLSCCVRYNPGADTDNIVRRREGCGNITLKDIKQVRKYYNNDVTSFLRKLDNKKRKNIDWASETDTDFLPDYERTKDTEFSKICKWINKNGGTAYESMDAVKVENCIRTDDCQSITLSMALSYDEEMKRLIQCTNKKNNEIKATIADLDIENIERSEKQAISKKLSFQLMKYCTRKSLIINLMGNIVYNQTHIDSKCLTPRTCDSPRDRTPEGAEEAVKFTERISDLLHTSSFDELCDIMLRSASEESEELFICPPLLGFPI